MKKFFWLIPPGFITIIFIYISVNTRRNTRVDYFRNPRKCKALLCGKTFTILKHKHNVYTNSEMTELILGYEKGLIFQQDQDDLEVREFKPLFTPYILNNENLCTSRKDPFYLVWIYSTPGRFQNRALIRKTWGQSDLIPGLTTVFVFLLGNVLSQRLQNAIENESETYGDIVQFDYFDSYHSLPYKGINALKWTTTFCQNTKYIIKTDDDVYLDIFRVGKALKALEPWKEPFVIGPIMHMIGVPRKGDIPKLVVRDDILPGIRFLPTYFYGWSYAIPYQLAVSMYKAANMTPVFHIDDAFMSGMLAGQVENVTFLVYSEKNRLKPVLQPNYFSIGVETIRKLPGMFCSHLKTILKSRNPTAQEYRDFIGRHTLSKLIRKQRCF